MERLVIGFCLVSTGALWTSANLGQIDLLSTLHTWWPLCLVVWGALELFNTLVIGRPHVPARDQAGPHEP